MPFQKGQSGNPGGRRREKPFAAALNMEIAAAGEDHKLLREIARKVLEQAAAGDSRSIEFVADRLDGRVAQAIIGGEEDDPAVQLISRIEIVAASGDDGQS